MLKISTALGAGVICIKCQEALAPHSHYCFQCGVLTPDTIAHSETIEFKHDDRLDWFAIIGFGSSVLSVIGITSLFYWM